MEPDLHIGGKVSIGPLYRLDLYLSSLLFFDRNAKDIDHAAPLIKSHPGVI
jgi:hypothetical protein